MSRGHTPTKAACDDTRHQEHPVAGALPAEQEPQDRERPKCKVAWNRKSRRQLRNMRSHSKPALLRVLCVVAIALLTSCGNDEKSSVDASSSESSSAQSMTVSSTTTKTSESSNDREDGLMTADSICDDIRDLVSAFPQLAGATVTDAVVRSGTSFVPEVRSTSECRVSLTDAEGQFNMSIQILELSAPASSLGCETIAFPDSLAREVQAKYGTPPLKCETRNLLSAIGLGSQALYLSGSYYNHGYSNLGDTWEMRLILAAD